jgi:pimeloyl-ACP methyl ester carboxylesterase
MLAATAAERGTRMTIRRREFTALSALGLAACATPDPAALRMEEFQVPALDAGISLYVRNKRPAAMSRFAPERTVVFVHGATYPAETAFDLALDGQSWMDYIAQRGYDVWLLDLRGYGRSTRPPEMAQPAEQNPPIVTGAVGQRDLDAVIDFIRAKRGLDKVTLLGWSWGTTLMATYTTRQPAKVARLVLYAPQFVRDNARLGPPPAAPKTAYRVVNRAQAKDRWLNGVPAAAKDGLIPAGWFEAWADATFATDPAGGGQTLRAPNGIVLDSSNGWWIGKPYYDPAKITVPTLLVVGEWDADTPPYMATALHERLSAAPTKRLVVLPEGTHTMLMERNRMKLFETVQRFLDSGS